jgi:hypothetical protein
MRKARISRVHAIRFVAIPKRSFRMIAKTLRVATFFLVAALAACGASDPSPSASSERAQRAESPSDEATASSSLSAATCNGTPGQWAGCRGTGCEVCSETTDLYPYYFANHPKCDRNLTCDGQVFTCNSHCPSPTKADKKPAAGRCNGTSGQWAGCRGNGCAVCSEAIADYPYYFLNHPSCVKNDTCAGQLFTCNASCPAPTDADKSPPAGTCNGTAGQWDGCRGNGCAVCTEKLQGFPRYFQNHPNCVSNPTCAGQFFTCNSNCPEPTNADRAAP